METIKKVANIDYSNIKHQQLKVRLSTQIKQAPFTAFTEQGSPIYYGKLDADTNDLVSVFESLEFGKSSARQSGLTQQSIYTNYSPRTNGRNNFCAASLFSSEHPEYQRLLNQYAVMMDEKYKNLFPEHYGWHTQLIGPDGANAILPNYKIGDTVFTSGIINKNSSLGCHKDSKNIPKALSAMLAVKRSVRGGYLILPEYDIAFPMEDNTILLFDGGEIMHGVSPIDFIGSNAYRYSVVFYTQKDMKNCLTPEDEIIITDKL